MARTTITAQTPTPAGDAIVDEPANVDGNRVDLAAGRRLLKVKAGGTAVTVTLPTPGTVDGLPIGDRSVAVPINSERIIVLTRALRQDDGTALVNYSQVTGVTVAVLAI